MATSIVRWSDSSVRTVRIYLMTIGGLFVAVGLLFFGIQIAALKFGRLIVAVAVEALLLVIMAINTENGGKVLGILRKPKTFWDFTLYWAIVYISYLIGRFARLIYLSNHVW